MKSLENTREKYMPEGRRQNSVETDRVFFYNQEEWVEQFWDDKGAFTMVVKMIMVIMMMRIIRKIWNKSLTDVLQNRCSWKVCKFHRKTPVLKFLFNKVADLQTFKNTFFYRMLLVAISENNEKQQLFEGFANSC